MKRFAALLYAASVLLSASAGCDGSTSSPPATEPTADASADASSACPPVPGVVVDGAATSFQNDVVPILRHSCAFESCHGTERADRVYLGDPATSRSALLAPSKRSDLALVTPFRPDASFLMHKLDGTTCNIADRCPDGCGESMPKAGELLDPAKRNAIRRWIADGALDD